MTAASLVVLLVWVRFLVMMLICRRRWLADLPRPAPLPHGSVALVFAARDEAAGIEAATRSFLAQELLPGLRIVAVDDRSEDGTSAILARLAAEDPRLEVVTIASLPEGWLGKTHALREGMGRLAPAEPRWLLFTDADVRFAPDAAARAVAYAEAASATHLTVYPEMDHGGFGERLFVGFFGLMFGLGHPSWAVESERSRNHLGIGAFNLVRREAFVAAGGFAHLSLSVDDDVRLGEMMKAAGGASRVLQGTDMVKVRWQNGLAGYIRGIEKNAYAGFGLSLVRTTVMTAAMAIAAIGPSLWLVFGSATARIASCASIAAMLAIMTLMRRSSRLSPAHALLAPAAASLVIWAILRSVWLTHRRGGIVWRRQLYAFAALRAHVRERQERVEAFYRLRR